MPLVGQDGVELTPLERWGAGMERTEAAQRKSCGQGAPSWAQAVALPCLL